jgi:hypothetical protein
VIEVANKKESWRWANARKKDEKSTKEGNKKKIMAKNKST